MEQVPRIGAQGVRQQGASVVGGGTVSDPIGLQLMHQAQFAQGHPPERVRPAQRRQQLEGDEVVGMAEAHVREFVLADGLAFRSGQMRRQMHPAQEGHRVGTAPAHDPPCRDDAP